MLKPRKKITKKQIKEDKLVTYYFKAIDYINQNSKLVMGSILGITAVIVLVLLFTWSKRNAELNASLELTKARVELANADHQRAIDILKSMIKNYSGTQSAGRGVFYLAGIHYEQKKYDEAFQFYKQYVDDFNEDVILSSASYSGMGACLEQKREFLEAAKYYKKGAEKYPKEFEAPGLFFNAARCYKLANNKLEAQKLYQRVIDNYPNSDYKRFAELYLNELQG